MPGALHLPCCFALESKKRHARYLGYVHEEGDETRYGQLQLNGDDDDVNPAFTRFDSEPSVLHQGMVHIRCRYNRKYWVPRQRGGGWWIVADGHEPDEDLDSPNCTLIKPIISVTDAVKEEDDDATTEAQVMTVRFLHAGHGKETRINLSEGTAACMRVGDAAAAAGDDDDAFIVLNFSSSPRRLPRFVVFKGHNNQYLSAVTINGRNHLRFSERDPGHPTVLHETNYPAERQDILLLRNIHLNRYWRHGNGEWILANYTPQEILNDVPVIPSQSRFTTVDVRDYFAISSHDSGTRNYYFLRSVPMDGVTNCLNLNSSSNRSITEDARIRVEEAVLDREIYNVEYKLGEARIYDTSVLTMATTAAVNDTSRENTKRLTLTYEEYEMNTWDATLELKLGVESRVRAGFPKLGLGGEVTISAEFFGAYNWGETLEKKVSHEVEYEVTVPPNTKVTVTLIASRSAVDIPYDYWQRDIMSTDGQARERFMTDGMYTGINSYNFKFQTTEEKLKPRIFVATPSDP